LEKENTDTNKNNKITFFATVNCLNITKLTSFLILKQLIYYAILYILIQLSLICL